LWIVICSLLHKHQSKLIPKSVCPLSQHERCAIIESNKPRHLHKVIRKWSEQVTAAIVCSYEGDDGYKYCIQYSIKYVLSYTYALFLYIPFLCTHL
jgi:hypothetical protein